MKRETRNGTRRRGLHGEQYPLDREEEARARALSEPVKQRRKEEVGGGKSCYTKSAPKEKQKY